MNLGFIVEQERQEAVERAMSRYRAIQRRTAAGRVTRGLSREEALNRIAKTHPRSAWKILNGYGLGNRNPVPERRGR
jgi:hypothetical protein